MMENNSPAVLPDLEEISSEAWSRVAHHRIYFGHQSVGYNILDGINDILSENTSVKLKIEEAVAIDGEETGVFVHSRIGKNFKPLTKIDDFVEKINTGIGNKADIVALKFCYVDVLGEQSPSDIFEAYKSAVDDIHRKYPNLTVLHFTMPLTSTSRFSIMRNSIGLKVKDYEANKLRNEYNALLLNYYGHKEPIFDIALIESTYPDGSRSNFSYKGGVYYSLVPEYTYDGGHLNEAGRKRVAEQLIIELSKID